MMSKRFTVLAILFCVCLIASNLFETKIFNAGFLTLTGGFVIFPLAYILNDCITEIYGYRQMRFVILTAFAVNAFVVTVAQFVRILPPAPFWDGQAHFDYIFKAELRITMASMAAFVIGSLANSKIMAKMKCAKGGFCLRAIASTFVGESIDSIIFFPIAFWGVEARNLLIMMVTQIALKTLYEVVMLPVTSRLVRHAKQQL